MLLNAKDNSWDHCHMKRQKDLRKPTSTEELWLALQDVWNNLLAEFLQQQLQLLWASSPQVLELCLWGFLAIHPEAHCEVRVSSLFHPEGFLSC